MRNDLTQRLLHNLLNGASTDAELMNLEPRALLSGNGLFPTVEVPQSLTEHAPAISIDVSNDFNVAAMNRNRALTSPTVTVRPNDFSTVNGSTARALIGLDKLQADARFSNIDGRGFSSVILDTGIDRDHSFFGPDANKDGINDRIVYQYDFADNDSDASDVNGHGSNVASIIGSQNASYKGVAPAVSLIVLKVFSNSGAGSFTVLEKALQWVATNTAKYNISSVNMSLGDNRNWKSNQQLYGISDELAKLATMNVKVVAAAGNSYGQFNSVGVSYPAADPNVLGVGAVFAGGSGTWSGGTISATNIAADEITPFSQRDSKLSPIFAPGSPMIGANANGGTVAMQGTSQATPVITGVAALADQIATKFIGRRLTTAEFRQLVVSSGKTIVDGDDETDTVTNTNLSFKRVDAFKLAEAIAAMAPKPVNVAPTMTSVQPLSGAITNQAFTISYDLLKAATDAKDANNDKILYRIDKVLSGTLLVNGKKVTTSVTVGAGNSITWIGVTAGAQKAFTIVATDGTLSSATALTVTINVTAPKVVAKATPAGINRTNFISAFDFDAKTIVVMA